MFLQLRQLTTMCVAPGLHRDAELKSGERNYDDQARTLNFSTVQVFGSPTPCLKDDWQVSCPEDRAWRYCALLEFYALVMSVASLPVCKENARTYQNMPGTDFADVA